MKENKAKNTILGGGILLILLLLVVGASYAYFGVDVDTSQSSPTNITAETEAVGIASLKGLINELHLNVSASDMSETNTGDYYATDDEAPHVKMKEEGTKKISQVEITSGPEELRYSCSVDVELSKSELENDIISVLQDGDMFINIEGEEQDLKEFFNTNPVTKKINFKIKGNNKKEISLYIKLINKETVQDYLAGKELGLDIKTQNLKCEIDTSKGMTGLQLAQSNPDGLKETNTGDLTYRFVGTQENDKAGNVKNYVCFGADDCSDNPTNDHLYRIIGITKEGNIKIQKNKAIGTSQWWTNYTTNKLWPDSIINTEALKEFYDSETIVSPAMKNKIENHTWNIGGVENYYTEIGDTVYNYEQYTQIHTDAIGLAYLSDYYYAYNEEGSQNCYNDPYCKSWMIPTNTEKLWSNTTNEWTMTRAGQTYGIYLAWIACLDGKVQDHPLDNDYALRPVFYLKDDVTISSGTGSLDDPFIIN